MSTPRRLSAGAQRLLEILEGLVAVSRHKFRLDHCWPSQEALAAKLERQPRQVRNLIRELVAAGRLEVRRPHRHRRANYHLLPAAPSERQTGNPLPVPERQSIAGLNERHTGNPLPVPERQSIAAPDRQSIAGLSESAPLEGLVFNSSSKAALDRGADAAAAPSTLGENPSLEKHAAAALHGAGLGRAIAAHHAAEDPALALVAADYFRELSSRHRRQPPELGLLVRFLQEPIDRGFERRAEGPPTDPATLADPDDAYRVWSPPPDSSWHRRQRSTAVADQRARAKADLAARQAEERAALSADRARRDRIWQLLTTEEQAAIRKAIVAEEVALGRGDRVPPDWRCAILAEKFLAAQEDLAVDQGWAPEDRARYEAEAARLYPLFFRQARTRRAATIMAFEALERQARRERACLAR